MVYVADLLQGAAQHWFRTEFDASHGPNRWVELGQVLLERYGKSTKPVYGQCNGSLILLLTSKH